MSDTTIKAALFDLDGVLVSTDRFHYEAWKRMADEEGIYFDYEINHRLRGVSRMQSLEIILERAEREIAQAEKDTMAERKNNYYRELIGTLTPADWLPGGRDLVEGLRARGIRCALCSSSKNAKTILDKIGGRDLFDTIVDGHDIVNTKPDPEIFLTAAERLSIDPAACVVFEDAESGVEAAKAARMKCIGIGDEANLAKADIAKPGVAEVTVAEVCSLG